MADAVKKQSGDMEIMVGVCLAIMSLCLSIIAVMKASDRAPASSVLIYDKQDIAKQVEPFLAAGHEPIAVIDAAVAKAVDQGFIVVDSSLDIKGPEQALLRLEDFVAVGSETGQLPDKPSQLSLDGVSDQPGPEMKATQPIVSATGERDQP